MFTGLIESTGKLRSLSPSLDQPSAARAVIEAKLPADIQIGQSIAVNGVCLTAIELNEDYFTADISPETLERTALKTYGPGRALNIEFPVRPTTYIGGHFVLGHVDGLGHVREIQMLDEFWHVTISFPEELAALIVEKGSITVDGVSLTINKLLTDSFELMLVPKTLEKTTLSHLHIGDAVNIEVDVLGKYIVRYLKLMKEKI
jgi:riboflavin synthase